MDIKQRLEKSGIITANQLNDLLDNKKINYNIYTIKQGKKNRVISQPNELLDSVQRALKPLYEDVPISKAAAAYEQGCSVASNAIRHSYGKHILHADIKSFFPSISKELFMSAYSKKYGSQDALLLWNIASLEGGLPVGSCLSPCIANRVMLRVDKKFKRIKMGIKYSRYADDMVFSSKKIIDKNIITKLIEILRSVGLKLNDKKTYFMTARKQVNGILVDKGRMSLGTNYKKQLKQQVYNILTKGSGNFRKIAGRLAYLKSIEPHYANVILRKYEALDNIGLFQRSGYCKPPIITWRDPRNKII